MQSKTSFATEQEKEVPGSYQAVPKIRPKRTTKKHALYSENDHEVNLDFSAEEEDGDYDVNNEDYASSETDEETRRRVAKKPKQTKAVNRIKKTPRKRSAYSTVSDKFLQTEFPKYIYDPKFANVLPNPEEIKAVLQKKNCPESLKKKEVHLIKHKVRNLRVSHQRLMQKAKKRLEY